MKIAVCSRCGTPHGPGEDNLTGKWGKTETVNVGYVRGVGHVRVDITVQPMTPEGGWIIEGNICDHCRTEVRDRAMAMSELAADVVRARILQGIPAAFDEKGTSVEVETTAYIKEAPCG